MNRTPNNSEVILEKFKEVLELNLDKRLFESLTRVEAREVLSQLAIEIQREFFAERKQTGIDVYFHFEKPATWWDFFKISNFPAWLLRRFPAKMVTVTQLKNVEFDRKFEFPEAYRPGHDILGKFVIRDYHRVSPHTF